MTSADRDPPRDPSLDHRIGRAVARARAAALWELVWRQAMVPLWLAGAIVAAAWLGLRDALPGLVGVVIFWSAAALVAAASLRAGRRIAAGWRAAASRTAALGRIERASGLARRELTGLEDRLAEGGGTGPATRALWLAHRRRLEGRIGPLTAGLPHPDWPRLDRFALRPALGLALFVGWFAASGDHVARLAGAFAAVESARPSDRLDVWIDPPAVTGLGPRSLMVDGAAVEDGTELKVPAGSRLVTRATAGGEGRVARPMEVTATPAAALTAEIPGEAATPAGEARRIVTGDGEIVLRHDGREVLRRRIAVLADRPPTISLAEAPTVRGRGGLRLVYGIDDDWGVVSAEARIAPRGHGRALYEPPGLPLVLPAGTRHVGRAETVRDLTAHPFAGALVDLTPVAVDGSGQEGHGEAVTIRLPERPFRDPLARALVEMRRRLALDAGEIGTVMIALDALTLAPERFGGGAGRHLGLRHLALQATRARDDAAMRALIEDLWTAAVTIDAGDTLDEEKALQAAREALAEALRSGASEEEIARLTRELRQAMERWLQAMTEAARRDPGARDRAEGAARRVDRKDLSRMLDRIEDLGRTGSRAAAERLLAELGDTLDQLRGARPGEGQAGERAAERALGDMIRRQRDLMDRTHRADRDGADAGERERLRNEQNALRDQLRRLRRSLGEDPGGEEAGGEDGPLGEAGRAMDEAGRAIDRGESGSAVDAQGRALDGLRRGARAMAEARGQGPGGSGSDGHAGEDGETDPLGRPRRSRNADGGRVGIPETIDVERARRILDDIRRRLGEPERPREERDYLDRLLEVD